MARELVYFVILRIFVILNKHNMALKPLGSMLKSSLHQKGALKRIEATLILAEFEKVVSSVVGENFKNFCEPVYFKDSVLAIKCTSSVAMQELQLNEARIICELNKILKDKIVREIRIFR